MIVENELLEKAKNKMWEKWNRYVAIEDNSDNYTDSEIAFNEYRMASETYRTLLRARYNL